MRTFNVTATRNITGARNTYPVVAANPVGAMRAVRALLDLMAPKDAELWKIVRCVETSPNN